MSSVRAARATRAASLVAAGALALAALACSSDDRAARDSATAAAAAASAKAAPPEPCPATGHWELCAVKKRLTMAGLAPRDSALSDTVKLGIPPKVYVAGGSALAVYLFPDSLTRRRAAATLDSTKFIAPDASLTMRHEATAIQNDNLLAILYSQRDQQRERVSDALVAGAPQKH